VIERMKYLHYKGIYANRYFWRTLQQQEVDYIEEKDGMLHAFEFKWNPEKKVTFSKSFLRSYPNHQTGIITPGKMSEFLLD
jgi:hypothetical protein